MNIEVGDKVELNNGNVRVVDRMSGDDPDHVHPLGYGPFVINGMRYHQNGRFGKSGFADPLSVKRIIQKASSFTLETLQVGPGDVVEYDGTRGGEVKRYTIAGWVNDRCYHTGQSIGGAFNMDPGSCWRVVRRWVNRDLLHGAEGFGEKIEFWDSLWEEGTESPTLWRDMTDEEKGALLLAHHEGREVQEFGFGHWGVSDPVEFIPSRAYRIKPKPLRETVTLMIDDGGMGGPRAIGTIDLEDGKPDPDSIKMEKV